MGVKLGEACGADSSDPGVLVAAGVKLGEVCDSDSSDPGVFVAARVKPGEACDTDSTDPCVTGAICDLYGTCSEYVEVFTVQ